MGAKGAKLDVGLALASHDLVGLMHSDAIFLERGWDKRWFGRLVNADLAAVSTLEREANPFRSLHKRLGDWLRGRGQADVSLPATSSNCLATT